MVAYSELLKNLGVELDKINIGKSIAEATYSNIRNQIRSIAYKLLPQRIDQRIIQTIASRGGELTLDNLHLILNLTIDILKERIQELETKGLVELKNKTVFLL
ncbi:MAG: hypothetical protein ACTSQB_03975 [Candidatus Heimdallarchaeota archaeon]